MERIRVMESWLPDRLKGAHLCVCVQKYSSTRGVLNEAFLYSPRVPVRLVPKTLLDLKLFPVQNRERAVWLEQCKDEIVQELKRFGWPYDDMVITTPAISDTITLCERAVIVCRLPREIDNPKLLKPPK